jgi:hypothetical protein
MGLADGVTVGAGWSVRSRVFMVQCLESKVDFRFERKRPLKAKQFHCLGHAVVLMVEPGGRVFESR